MPPLTIYPYRCHETWVFDDPRTGLKEEAFVSGADTMIDTVIAAKGIPKAAEGFSLSFSDMPFPGYEVELKWLRADPLEGNWYSAVVGGTYIEGWLCPALFLYFATAPQRIFVRAEPLPAGINPIWNPPPGAIPRQFVGPGDEPGGQPSSPRA
jgi:hypothetical protein